MYGLEWQMVRPRFCMVGADSVCWVGGVARLMEQAVP